MKREDDSQKNGLVDQNIPLLLHDAGCHCQLPVQTAWKTISFLSFNLSPHNSVCVLLRDDR